MRNRQMVAFAAVLVVIIAFLGYKNYEKFAVAASTPTGNAFYVSQTIIESYASQTLGGITMPKRFVYIPDGTRTKAACINRGTGNGIQTDMSVEYCAGDDTVYGGEELLQMIDNVGGDTAVLVALAHEFGHHVELISGSFNKLTDQAKEEIADCVSGAVSEFAFQHSLAGDPTGPGTVATYSLGQIESGQADIHGTPGQRLSYLQTGASGGITACFNM